MIAFIHLVLSLLLVSTSTTLASPVPSKSLRLRLLPLNKRGLLCQIPVINKILCAQKGTSAISINTPIGAAKGVVDPAGAVRFAVKYGSAARWGTSSVATTWQLP